MILIDDLIANLPLSVLLSIISGYLLYLTYSSKSKLSDILDKQTFAKSVLIGLVILVITVLLAISIPSTFSYCKGAEGGCLPDLLGVITILSMFGLSISMAIFAFYVSNFPKWLTGFIGVAIIVLFIIFFLNYFSNNMVSAFYGEQVFLEHSDGKYFVNVYTQYTQTQTDYQKLLTGVFINCNDINLSLTNTTCPNGLPLILNPKVIEKVHCQLPADFNLMQLSKCTNVGYTINGYTPSINHAPIDSNLLNEIANISN
ncbi:MAG: hypothetical protein WC462_00115 [archaeon]